MESYKSDVQTIACDIETVFNKLSNPEIFKAQIDKNADKLPKEAQENLSKVKFAPDSITIESPMGPMTLALAEKEEPTKIMFTAQNSPVAFNLIIGLDKIDDETTQARSELQIDIPFMLRAMVDGQLKQGAQQFAEMLTKLPYKDL